MPSSANSVIYPKAKESFLSQSPSIDLDGDDIKVCLVDITTDYTYSSTHQYKSSVKSYGEATASLNIADQTLGGKAVTNGVFDANNSTFSSVAASGSKTVGALVIYKDTGNVSTSPLIAYIELNTAITPNTGNITVTWSDGASKIFAL